MILIRTDASPVLGLGHLMRCLAIAEQVLKHGVNVTIIIKKPNNHIRRLVEDTGANLCALPSDIERKEEVTELNYLISSLNPLAIILDGYNFDSDYQQAIKQKNLKLVCIGMQDKGYYCADIIINPNPWAATEPYINRVGATTQLLVGAEYVLLRDKVKKIRKTSINESCQDILLTFGGGKSTLLGFEICRSLKDLPYHFHLLLSTEPDRSLEVDNNFNLTIYKDFDSMVPLMEKCDLAVTAAGVTCWELCYVGVPFVNVMIAENQLANANFLEENDISVTMGNIDHLDGNLLIEVVGDLASNNFKRKAMAERGQALIDGHGAERVARVLLDDC